MPAFAAIRSGFGRQAPEEDYEYRIGVLAFPWSDGSTSNPEPGTGTRDSAPGPCARLNPAVADLGSDIPWIHNEELLLLRAEIRWNTGDRRAPLRI